MGDKCDLTPVDNRTGMEKHFNPTESEEYDLEYGLNKARMPESIKLSHAPAPTAFEQPNKFYRSRKTVEAETRQRLKDQSVGTNTISWEEYKKLKPSKVEEQLNTHFPKLDQDAK